VCYRIDLNTSYLYDTSIFYAANFSYAVANRTYFYVLNATEYFTLEYNVSCYLLDARIYTLYLNLTVNNMTLYQFYTYNYSAGEFYLNQSSNYTDTLLSSCFYNATQFCLRFVANSTIEYTLNYSITLEREYYEIWNCTSYSADDYRLISEGNRQNPNNLVFEQWYETLAIVDFFGNVLYRKLTLYSNFTDIGLPIFTLTVVNNHNYTIYSQIERGLGVYLVYVVPPESSISARIFATNYRVEIRNLELQLLNVTSVSSNSSKQVVVTVGERQDINAPVPDIWAILRHFFFGTWYGILLFLFVVTSTITLFIDTALNITRRQKKKKRKRAEIMVI
jgi:hypothetical protein